MSTHTGRFERKDVNRKAAPLPKKVIFMNCETIDNLMNDIKSGYIGKDIPDIIRFEAIKAHMNRYLHLWSKIEASIQETDDLIAGFANEALCKEMAKIKTLLPHIADCKDFEIVRGNLELYADALDKLKDEETGETCTTMSPNEAIYLACKRYVELYQKGEAYQPHSKELNQLECDLHVLTDETASDWSYPGENGFNYVTE